MYTSHHAASHMTNAISTRSGRDTGRNGYARRSAFRSSHGARSNANDGVGVRTRKGRMSRAG